MWFSFLRSRDRFSLDELRYLIDQLMKIQNVNNINKDFVIEALRSIAELIIYGDQHDASYFEFFMEKQVMGEFVRILRISRTLVVSLQILQTMSIIIQNLKSEHAIYYIFSNEHVNYLISYSFDFRNEELLSYYISFLRAISGKLNRDTISLLVKTQKDEVVSFPLYVEAIQFAFHEESMIRTAVRALTLNVYHVGDVAVNRFLSRAPHADYFLNLINFFREQCIRLNLIVSNASKEPDMDSTSSILVAVDEIEDNLYYISDVVSAGIPDVGRLIMDNILTLLILPSILPSLSNVPAKEPRLGAITSVYLLCCILRIVKIKDLANTVAASLLCCLQTLIQNSFIKSNGMMFGHLSSDAASQNTDGNSCGLETDIRNLQVTSPVSSSQNLPQDGIMIHDSAGAFSSWDALLSFIVSGNDVQVSGSLGLLATLLQTKELDESIVDALGILPQRKQHKKKLLEALVGEDSGEEQLFSSQSSGAEDDITSELDIYLQKLKEYAGVPCASPNVEVSPHVRRYQVLDALVSLFCRSNISAETLWDGGWLLRQLLPYSEAEFNRNHLRLLKDSFDFCTTRVLEETRGTWCDMLAMVIGDEWRKCKKAIEASSPRKDPKCMLLPPRKSAFDGTPFSFPPFALTLAREYRMFATALALSFEKSNKQKLMAAPLISQSKLALNLLLLLEKECVFVLLHHLHIFSLGRVLPEQPPVVTVLEIPDESRAKKAAINPAGLKTNTEVNLVDAVPCRIAFERGRERNFHLLALSVGSSGWLVLLDEFPMKPRHGVVRVAAPLAGCNPRVDEKHSRWLHLRIRPSSFPFTETSNYTAHGRVKSKALVDGRWTLAFRDEESCKYALGMILEEMKLQNCIVESSLRPLLDLDMTS